MTAAPARTPTPGERRPVEDVWLVVGNLSARLFVEKLQEPIARLGGGRLT